VTCDQKIGRIVIILFGLYSFTHPPTPSLKKEGECIKPGTPEGSNIHRKMKHCYNLTPWPPLQFGEGEEGVGG